MTVNELVVAILKPFRESAIYLDRHHTLGGKEITGPRKTCNEILQASDFVMEW